MSPQSLEGSQFSVLIIYQAWVYTFALHMSFFLLKMVLTDAGKKLKNEIMKSILTVRRNAYRDPPEGKQWSQLQQGFNDLTLVTGNCLLQTIVCEIGSLNMPSDVMDFKGSIGTFDVHSSFPLRLSELIMGLQLGYMLLERFASKVQMWSCYYFTWKFWMDPQRPHSRIKSKPHTAWLWKPSFNPIPSILLLDIFMKYEKDGTAQDVIE